MLQAYDAVATEYAETFFRELERKPFDRVLLDEFAWRVAGEGPVLEVGCGPGQIARYLKDKHVDVRGLDLSEEMVRVARSLNRDIEFRQGDMLTPEEPSDSLAG